jgi:hypothetical protein
MSFLSANSFFGSLIRSDLKLKVNVEPMPNSDFTVRVPDRPVLIFLQRCSPIPWLYWFMEVLV